MTPELIAFLGQYGLPITMLIVVIVSGARGIWRWGREVDAANARADKAELRADKWQGVALDALKVSKDVVAVVANGKPL